MNESDYQLMVLQQMRALLFGGLQRLAAGTRAHDELFGLINELHQAACLVNHEYRARVNESAVNITAALLTVMHPMPCPMNPEYGHPCTCARRQS